MPVTRLLREALRLILIIILLADSLPGSAQTCTTNLYGKYYDVNAPKVDFFFTLPGGGTIFGGRSFSTDAQIDIIKTKPDGNILWRKQTGGNSYAYPVSKACLTQDFKILVGQGPNLVLIDTNGIFIKGITSSLPNGSYTLRDMKVDVNGNIVVLYYHNSNSYTNGDSYFLAKYKSDLSGVLWVTSFGNMYSYFSNLNFDVDKIFVCGSYSLYNTDSNDGSLICFDNKSGALTKQMCFTLNGYTTKFFDVQRSKNGYLLKGFYYPTGGVSTTVYFEKHVIVRLDTVLQPIRAFRFTGVIDNDNLLIATEPDGSFYGVHGSSSLETFFYGNKNDSIVWTRYNNIVYYAGWKPSQFFKTNSNLWMVSEFPIAAHKADLNGTIGTCVTYPLPFGTLPLSVAVKNKTLVATDTTNFVLSPVNYTLSDQTFNTINQCNATSSCSSVKITGQTNICTTGGAITFKGRRNAGCRLPVQWQILGSTVDQDNLNDSTVSVKFLSSGSYQLIATLPADCMIIADTMNVFVSLTTQASLNLGSDRTLCTGNTILLNAHKGFASYLWQDGSTDSTYIVTKPGLYFVTTTDACGGTYKDSVTITAAPPIPFDVGPYRTKCNSDTIQFNAPAGFMNYAWSPAYNISSTSQANVVVNPSVDTTYYVKAELTPGCFAYDTIRVRVNHSPVIDLGADRSFCSGDSVVLDSGTGFTIYLWNGATGSQMRTVYAAGTYSVMGTTAQGCKSYDTVAVTNVWSLPQVHLDKKAELCTGDSRTLNAGNFSSYVWQDGSTGSTFKATGIGTYYVQVTDNHNCVGSDTTYITTMLPLPHGFLPADTTLCSYSKMTLQPLQNYSSYLWDNGSRTNSVIVDKPGTYRLEVQDNSGCVGRDSIVISPKQCMSGVYLPTAFSPNRDGKNDVFRAMVYGVTKKFELTIYNRWGQMIFYTADVTKGWDGKVAGVEQDTAVFVWVCRYQLEGGQESLEKGTVTLIR